VRKAKKEAFHSSSKLVDTQEELKATKQSVRQALESAEKNVLLLRQVTEEASSERAKVVAIEREAEVLRERVALLESEREELRKVVEEKELLRIAAEGRLPLPLDADDDFSLLEGAEEKPVQPKSAEEKVSIQTIIVEVDRPPKRSWRGLTIEEELQSENSELKSQVKDLEITMEEMHMECQFQACACRIAEARGKEYIRDSSTRDPDFKAKMDAEVAYFDGKIAWAKAEIAAHPEKYSRPVSKSTSSDIGIGKNGLSDGRKRKPWQPTRTQPFFENETIIDPWEPIDFWNLCDPVIPEWYKGPVIGPNGEEPHWSTPIDSETGERVEPRAEDYDENALNYFDALPLPEEMEAEIKRYERTRPTSRTLLLPKPRSEMTESDYAELRRVHQEAEDAYYGPLEKEDEEERQQRIAQGLPVWTPGVFPILGLGLVEEDIETEETNETVPMSEEAPEVAEGDDTITLSRPQSPTEVTYTINEELTLILPSHLSGLSSATASASMATMPPQPSISAPPAPSAASRSVFPPPVASATATPAQARDKKRSLSFDAELKIPLATPSSSHRAALDPAMLASQSVRVERVRGDHSRTTPTFTSSATASVPSYAAATSSSSSAATANDRSRIQHHANSNSRTFHDRGEVTLHTTTVPVPLKAEPDRAAVPYHQQIQQQYLSRQEQQPQQHRQPHQYLSRPASRSSHSRTDSASSTSSAGGHHPSTPGRNNNNKDNTPLQAPLTPRTMSREAALAAIQQRRDRAKSAGRNVSGGR
jgi:hypothetical protein